MGGGMAHSATPVDFNIIRVLDSPSEGPSRLRPYITVEERRISFREPVFCSVSSDTEALTVHLQKAGQRGQFTITNSALKTSTDFAANVETYMKAAQSALPKDAEGAACTGADFDPYKVNDFKSLAFDWQYTLNSRQMHQQVAYINIDPAHQICVTVLSDEDTAQETLGTVKRFLNSWYWLEGVVSPSK